MSTIESAHTVLPNGAALAAFTAAAVGTFAMGAVSLLDASGVLTVPALYGPAGGVSGRTTVAVLIWVITWAVLHRRWKARDLATGGVHAVAFALTVLGILLALPPMWSLFG